MKVTKQAWSTAIPLGMALSMIPAGFMARAAWIHNAQGEIHGEGVVDWGYLSLIAASWFVPVFLVVTTGLLFFFSAKKTIQQGLIDDHTVLDRNRFLSGWIKASQRFGEWAEPRSM